MISVKDMLIAEKKAMEFGVSEAVLMENAGSNALCVIEKKISLKNKKILVFCGTGNNAGDGLVLARHALMHGAHVSVYFAKKPGVLRSETTRKNYTILKALSSMGHKVKFYIEKFPEAKYDILVDALLGTGVRDNVSEEYAKIIKKFNEIKGLKRSLDCPSGINCDTGKVMGTAIKPDMTITFYENKKGLNKKNSGKIIVVNIGIPNI